MSRKRYTFEVMRGGRWEKVYSTFDLNAVRRDVAESIPEGVHARYTQSLAHDRSSSFQLLLHRTAA